MNQALVTLSAAEAATPQPSGVAVQLAISLIANIMFAMSAVPKLWHTP